MWDEATNQQVFGKCNNPHFHGHNYELVIKVTGEPDPQTGYVMDMKLLSDIAQENVLERFDHKNLNDDTAEFKNLNPTAENIAIVIYNILREKLIQNLICKYACMKQREILWIIRHKSKIVNLPVGRQV